jgi:hypothetical protein
MLLLTDGNRWLVSERRFTVLSPDFIEDRLQTACAPLYVVDTELAGRVLAASRTLYSIAWEAGISTRPVEENSRMHELIVWIHTVRIATAEGVRDYFAWIVLILVCFFHDLYEAGKITEQMIAEAPPEKRTGMRERKVNIRWEHMHGSAAKTRKLLAGCEDLVSRAVLRQAVGYIAMHDACKVGCAYPLSSDPLAVYAFEGDVLWPLETEFGARADLERLGNHRPPAAELVAQAKANLATQLLAYPEISFGSTLEPFRGGTLIRTTEGACILREYLEYWGLPAMPGL